MRRSASTVLVVALACLILFPAPAHAGKGKKGGVTVTMAREIPFAESSGATSNVKSECTLQTRLPGFIQDYSKKVNLVLVDEVSEESEGRVLTLEIIGVVGFGGGAWSGAKNVTVEGTLTENGEVIGTFVAMRYSGGGAFGGFKGTCSILGRCIKTLGSDIAKWLAEPRMDAMLGNA